MFSDIPSAKTPYLACAEADLKILITIHLQRIPCVKVLYYILYNTAVKSA